MGLSVEQVGSVLSTDGRDGGSRWRCRAGAGEREGKAARDRSVVSGQEAQTSLKRRTELGLPEICSPCVKPEPEPISDRSLHLSPSEHGCEPDAGRHGIEAWIIRGDASGETCSGALAGS